MLQFRPNTENMSREERLNHAQNFAEIFEKLILQDAEEDGSVPTDWIEQYLNKFIITFINTLNNNNNKKVYTFYYY